MGSMAWPGRRGHIEGNRRTVLTSVIAGVATSWLLLAPVVFLLIDDIARLMLGVAWAIGMVLYVVAASLNRRGYVDHASGLVVFTTLLMGWSLAFFSMGAPRVHLLPFVGEAAFLLEFMHQAALFLSLVPLVLAATLLRPWVVLVTAACNLGVIGFLEYMVPTPSHLAAFALTMVIGSLLAVSAKAMMSEHGGRMRSQARLQEILRQQAAALESDPKAVWSVDENGKVTFSNNMGRQFLDRHPLGLLEKSPFGDKLREMHAAAMDGQTFQEQVELPGEKHPEVWQLGAFPLQTATGIEGALFHFRDATDEVHAQTLRQEAYESNLAAQHHAWRSEFKSRILNIASHELNTPLTPMRLQLQMLMRHAGDLTPPQEKAVAMIARNADRLQRLVSDLLEMSRIDGGRVELQRYEFDLGRLLAEEVENAGMATPTANISYHGPESTVFVGDEQRLGQVVTNLLSNAGKFCPEGEITVSLEEAEDHYLVSVADTGRGIDPERIEELFEPFAQVHENRHEIRGNGLGLCISKGLVEAHGGDMECASPGLGEGTTFSFWLPFEKPLEAMAVTSQAAEP